MGVLELLSYIARLVERDRGGLSNHIADISSDIAILVHTYTVMLHSGPYIFTDR